MKAALAQLPNDVDALKRLLIERDEELAAARSERLVLTTLIEHLKLQIARLKRMHAVRAQLRETR